MVKLKKSQLKELVRHAIREVISEQEYKAKHKGGKVVTFKNKDHWKDALKTGDYEMVLYLICFIRIKSLE